MRKSKAPFTPDAEGLCMQKMERTAAFWGVHTVLQVTSHQKICANLLPRPVWTGPVNIRISEAEGCFLLSLSESCQNILYSKMKWLWIVQFFLHYNFQLYFGNMTMYLKLLKDINLMVETQINGEISCCVKMQNFFFCFSMEESLNRTTAIKSVSRDFFHKPNDSIFLDASLQFMTDKPRHKHFPHFSVFLKKVGTCNSLISLSLRNLLEVLSLCFLLSLHVSELLNVS